MKGSIKISSGEEDLRMYQLGYMSGPSPKAKEAMSSGGIQRWTWRKNEQAWKHTWQGVTGRVNLECFFIHGSTVENPIQAILDGALKPTTFETAKDPICGVPGVYFSELPSLDEEDIIRAWHQNKSSGYNRGAVIICKLVGAPLNNDKTGQNTVIEEGMISTKIGSKGVLQIAAHENCIRYVAAVFNEDLLNSYLGKVMERLRGYSPSMHESLKAVKAFLESGTKDKNEPMIALQNVLVNSASTKPAKPVPLPPPPPPPVHWCGVPAYIHSTLFPWQWQEWSWAKSPPPPQPPPRISPPPQPTEPPPHDAAESGSSKSYRSGSSVTIWPGPDRSRHTEHQEPEDTQEHTRHKATQSKWAPRRQSTQEPEDTQELPHRAPGHPEDRAPRSQKTPRRHKHKRHKKDTRHQDQHTDTVAVPEYKFVRRKHRRNKKDTRHKEKEPKKEPSGSGSASGVFSMDMKQWNERLKKMQEKEPQKKKADP